MIILAGPNGSGKTTFATLLAQRVAIGNDGGSFAGGAAPPY